MAGAILGTCLGGPVGFLAGVKIGGLAAIGGSVFGKRSQTRSLFERRDFGGLRTLDDWKTDGPRPSMRTSANLANRRPSKMD